MVQLLDWDLAVYQILSRLNVLDALALGITVLKLLGFKFAHAWTFRAQGSSAFEAWFGHSADRLDY